MSKLSIAMLAAMIATHSMASAAVIRASEADGCQLELSGEIAAGDLVQLKALARTFGLDGPIEAGEASNSEDEALCLSSPGGQYVEGRSLAHFVHENGIATRLLPGAECYSACALVFMAGRLAGAEEDYPSRTMHITAKLGFHAPYFNYSASETFGGDKVNETVVLNNLLLADFIAFGSTTSIFQYRPMFPISLIKAMLSATPDKFEMVGTLDKAARWGIGLEGVAERGYVDDAGMQRACVNFQAWATDQSALDGDQASQIDRPLPRVTFERDGKAQEFAVADTGGMEVSQCHVASHTSKVASIEICSRDDFSGRNFGDCQEGASIWLPWFYSLPPGTPLPSLGWIDTGNSGGTMPPRPIARPSHADFPAD